MQAGDLGPTVGPVKNRILLAAVVAGLSTVGVATAVPAQAASSVVISLVKFDSSGVDRPATTKKLDDEYVELKNTGSTDIAVSGWTLTDKAGHRYVVGKKTVIKAGDWMRIHTGPGRNTPHHRYWGQKWYVWNNTTDVATLRNRNDVQRDVCSWPTKHKGNTKIC
jgi:hypothetical protein